MNFNTAEMPGHKRRLIAKEPQITQQGPSSGPQTLLDHLGSFQKS